MKKILKVIFYSIWFFGGLLTLLLALSRISNNIGNLFINLVVIICLISTFIIKIHNRLIKMQIKKVRNELMKETDRMEPIDNAR